MNQDNEGYKRLVRALRRQRTCYRCGRRLTREEAGSFVVGFPYPVCDECASKPEPATPGS